MLHSFHLSIGSSSECPASAPQPDGTECLEKGLCRNGTCLPFCETQGYQSCMCDTVSDACKRCCRYHLNDTCFPFEPFDILPDGTPCIHGFCNSVSFFSPNPFCKILSFKIVVFINRAFARKRFKISSNAFGTLWRNLASTVSWPC